MRPQHCFGIVLMAVAMGLSGCTSVESTSQFYLSETTRNYPPKADDVPIPIMAEPPKEPHSVIGRLAFSSDLGWKFLRKSMLYNARVNGADAVILKSLKTRREEVFYDVPPRTDWIPVRGFVEGRDGRVRSYTNWVPIFRPGYVGRNVLEIMAIDSEMIVLEK